MNASLLRSSLVFALPFFCFACSSSDDGAGENTGASGGSDNNQAGNQNGGSGGQNSGGTSGGSSGNSQTNGGAGGSSGSGDGGTSAGGAGPGIPTDGGVYCLNETTNADAAFYFGVSSTCYVMQPKSGELSSDQVTLVGGLCSALYGGTVVSACPADKTPVAYCAGEQLAAGLTLNVTRIIYDSDVNPDAVTVARNSLAVCGTLTPYDLNDKMLSTSCTGTFSADVDGAPVDFSKRLTCLFRTDGTKSTYFVRGADSTNSIDTKELTLKVIKNGAGDVEYFSEVLQPPVGYLEGSTAAGAFPFPADQTQLTIAASRYEMDGSGFAASFDFGPMSTSPTASDNVRVITGGEIDIQFDVE